MANKTENHKVAIGACLVASALTGAGCTTERSDASAQELANRAYIVSRESDELTVIDLDTLEITAQVKTAGISNHMAEVNADFTKVYIDSSETDETVVVDAKALEVI